MSYKRMILGAVLAVVTVVSGCGGSSGGIDADEVTGVPEDWINVTAKGWPDSDSFGSSTPILKRDDCELMDDLPEIMGSTPEITETGWGALGPDSGNKDAYRYTCGFWSKDNYSGSIDLLHPEDEAQAQENVADFKNQPDIPEQDNTVTTETVGDLEVHVVERWYPTNPHGAYLALYHDEDSGAHVLLKISSLDKADFDEFSAQKTADTLIDLIALGS